MSLGMGTTISGPITGSQPRASISPSGLSSRTEVRMLDDTLVVWGGEFGRTSDTQAGRAGTAIPMPSRVDGWRRYQGGSTTVRVTNLGTRPWKTGLASMTCMPPFFTSSASITNASPTSSMAQLPPHGVAGECSAKSSPDQHSKHYLSRTLGVRPSGLSAAENLLSR